MKENEWAIFTDITVNWGDMDALGHVNHSIFAKWMESVRMIYFSKIGIMEMYEKSNIGPILARLEVDYKSPIVFPDVVRSKTSISRIGNSSFDMKYQIHSLNQKDGVVANGKVVCVLIDYKSGKPVHIPDVLRKAIIELEGEVPVND
tara:strand:- start:326 stop:766 length:441 start_codon:yes stop_codon:yes gene_type:complete